MGDFARQQVDGMGKTAAVLGLLEPVVRFVGIVADKKGGVADMGVPPPVIAKMVVVPKIIESETPDVDGSVCKQFFDLVLEFFLEDFVGVQHENPLGIALYGLFPLLFSQEPLVGKEGVGGFHYRNVDAFQRLFA